MAPKNMKPLIDIAKEHGPKAGKFLYDHAGKIGPTFIAAQGIIEKLAENKKNKADGGKIHLRKERYDEFNKSIMRNLNDYNREELHAYKHEAMEFIEQIELEMSKETKAKKPLHIKRRKNWEALLVQIDGKIKMKDYLEYLKIYNKDEYTSTYFEGFERNVKEFKKLVEKADSNEIINFLVSQTNMDPTIIRNEFL